MQNVLSYQQVTRQRWINGKLYSFEHYSEPEYKRSPPFSEITVRRWNGFRWEVIHRFN